MIIFLILLVLLILIILAIMIYAYFATFYSSNKKADSDAIKLPNQPIYTSFKDVIIKDIMDVRKLKYKQYFIKSFDGLLLSAKYYEHYKNAPIEIMFHGYRGSSERDLSTGVKRAALCGHNVLLIDQRASGNSQGHTISFGINEHKDCLRWITFIKKKFGIHTKIILTGISMGAATIMMTSSLKLPKNVIGLIADCGYTSPKEIIKKVIKDMKLFPNLLYPFVYFSARVFGKFKLNETSPIECVRKTKLPIIFFHGTIDSFVPHEMSKTLFKECKSKKYIFIVENAEHGISYLVEPEKYINYVKQFFK